MVHGSAFAPVIEAVADLLPRGFAFASPHPHQVALGELLAARLPSVQRVRFTNSGTEAALLAAKIAVRATGRRRLLVFDGAYHGSATLFLAGSRDVVRVPWNDLDAVAALLGRPDHDVAAVFAEPFLGAGGVRPAAPGTWPRWPPWPTTLACCSSWTRCRGFATGLAASRATSG